jgi:ArsR family transcriptional regulator
MKDVVKIFKALSDPTRLRITLLLLRRELCVCELTFILRMEQSRISHHMRVLREADIVEDVRDGRWIIYRVPEEARGLLAGLISGALRERIALSHEASEDVEKLEDCVRQNVRGSACESRPRAEGT